MLTRHVTPFARKDANRRVSAIEREYRGFAMRSVTKTFSSRNRRLVI